MNDDSCYRKFVQVIPLILNSGPLSTADIYKKIEKVLPECITNKRCDHGKGGVKRSDFEWQHSVRRAQYYLKGRGKIRLIGEKWYSSQNSENLRGLEEMEAENLIINENIDTIREQLRSLTPKSPEYESINGIKFKRDRVTVARLKILRGFKCQICGTTIKKKDGGRYAEGAHIKPKSEGTAETPDNIMIMCPNHHKEFDLGETRIIEHTVEKIRFTLNGKEYLVNLSI